MGWIFQRACDGFDQYRQMWDAINRTQGNHILLDSTFVGLLIRHFSSNETLLGISANSNSPGVVVVTRSRKGFWQTFQPSQAPLGLCVFSDGDNVQDRIQELMRSLPGYAVGFSVLQQDPDYTAFRSLDESEKAEVVDYIRTPRLTLEGNFPDYWKGRGKNLVHTLSRQRRRLAERGIQLELVVDRDPDQVSNCIQEYGQLEAVGWKGREGTAVTAGNHQALFYEELLKNFCSQGEAVIYRLLMNGKTIASDLCLQRDAKMMILKTAYDEGIQGISPGMLMHEEIFKALFCQGKIKVIEFYGRLRDWHTKWTNEVRTMFHVNFYRYDWLAVARRIWKSRCISH